ncbi:hypothetical protein [Aeromonas caviae]|uniref:hypothetical protein n=1 Tax=Aeromonas caviae TaxID=648 RepID=UPI003EC87CBF
MIRFPSYSSQKDLNNGRNVINGRPAVDAFLHRSLGLRHSRDLSHLGLSAHESYLYQLRSSEPYLAMLRQQWAEDQAAALPLDLKAHYADKETHHIQVGSFAYLDDAALLKYGDINAPEHCQYRHDMTVRNHYLLPWFRSAYSQALEYADLLTANQRIKELYDLMNVSGDCGTLSLTSDDEGFEAFAERLAKHVMTIRRDYYDGDEDEYRAFKVVHALLVGYDFRDAGFDYDFENPNAPRPCHWLNRWCDPTYLVRLIRRVSARRLFDAARLAGVVGKFAQPYAPDYLVLRRGHRIHKNRSTLSGLAAVCLDDELVGCPLTDAIDASVSNPEVLHIPADHEHQFRFNVNTISGPM